MGCGCGKKNKGAKTNKPTLIGKDGFVVNETPNKKEGPGLLKKALNFGEALVDHVADGMTTVTKLQLSARLAVCTKCPFNKQGSCDKCGCVIATKAKWRSSDCPLDYWPTFKRD